MSGFDVEYAGSGLPVWAAGALAALLLGGGALAFQRAGQTGFVGIASRVALVIIGVVAAWGALTWTGGRDIGAARRALEARSTELASRAIAPGVAFACLDAIDNQAVEAACERAVFASAETVAAALSYMDARLALLRDGLELAEQDPSYARTLARLRRGIEQDRFGFVAQVLATHGCQDDGCPLFKLFADGTRIAANLKERTFDARVEAHAANWPHGDITVATSPPSQSAGSAPPAVHPMASIGRYDFPSAASIPPVSIMNAEPTAPPAQSAPNPQVPASERKPDMPAQRASPPARRSSGHEARPREPMGIVPLPQPAPGQPGQSSSLR